MATAARSSHVRPSAVGRAVLLGAVVVASLLAIFVIRQWALPGLDFVSIATLAGLIGISLWLVARPPDKV